MISYLWIIFYLHVQLDILLILFFIVTLRQYIFLTTQPPFFREAGESEVSVIGLSAVLTTLFYILYFFMAMT